MAASFPAVGDTFPSPPALYLACHRAAYQQQFRLQAQRIPLDGSWTIAASCCLKIDSTAVGEGSGLPCSFSVVAKADQSGPQYTVTSVFLQHTCSADVLAARKDAAVEHQREQVRSAAAALMRRQRKPLHPDMRRAAVASGGDGGSTRKREADEEDEGEEQEQDEGGDDEEAVECRLLKRSESEQIYPKAKRIAEDVSAALQNGPLSLAGWDDTFPTGRAVLLHLYAYAQQEGFALEISAGRSLRHFKLACTMAKRKMPCPCGFEARRGVDSLWRVVDAKLKHTHALGDAQAASAADSQQSGRAGASLADPLVSTADELDSFQTGVETASSKRRPRKRRKKAATPLPLSDPASAPTVALPSDQPLSALPFSLTSADAVELPDPELPVVEEPTVVVPHGGPATPLPPGPSVSLVPYDLSPSPSPPPPSASAPPAPALHEDVEPAPVVALSASTPTLPPPSASAAPVSSAPRTRSPSIEPEVVDEDVKPALPSHTASPPAETAPAPPPTTVSGALTCPSAPTGSHAEHEDVKPILPNAFTLSNPKRPSPSPAPPPTNTSLRPSTPPPAWSDFSVALPAFIAALSPPSSLSLSGFSSLAALFTSLGFSTVDDLSAVLSMEEHSLRLLLEVVLMGQGEQACEELGRVFGQMRSSAGVGM